jgi:hypothetical protein
MGVFKFSPGHCSVAADCGCAIGCLTCPTLTPRTLTISWSNIFSGGGSALMAYVSGCLWTTACVGPSSNIVYTLNLSTSPPVLTYAIYSVGTCPGGTPAATCSAVPYNAGTSTCTPFSQSFTVTNVGCPNAFAGGYRAYTITP